MPEEEHREEAKAANETDVELGRRVRFPYARIAAGVVGVLLSVWLWVGESWRFDVTPRELVEGPPGWGWRGGWVGKYVRLSGKAHLADPVHGATTVTVSDLTDPGASVPVVAKAEHYAPLLYMVHEVAPPHHLTGRVLRQGSRDEPAALAVDATRGRWTGKSVLAVFVFLWGAGIIVSSTWVWRKRHQGVLVTTAQEERPSQS